MERVFRDLGSPATVALALRWAHSMRSMIPANNEAAYRFNVHHGGKDNQRQSSLVEQGAEEYQKDTGIAA